MSDTKTDAESALAYSDGSSNYDVQATRAMALATLYLAEQQRLANIIAYWQLHTPRSAVESYENHHIEVHEIVTDNEQSIDNQIREGLGL